MKDKKANFVELSYPVLILLGIGAFFFHFSYRGISNNTPEAIKSIAFFLPAVALLTVGFLHTLSKKRFSHFYLMTIVLYFLLLVLMLIFAF